MSAMTRLWLKATVIVTAYWTLLVAGTWAVQVITR